MLAVFPLLCLLGMGCLILPGGFDVAKTWAPVGQTPIHRHVYRRDQISVISGISVSPKRQRLNLYYYLFYDNIGRRSVFVSPSPDSASLRSPDCIAG
jgi:hypothetical protein